MRRKRKGKERGGGVRNEGHAEGGVDLFREARRTGKETYVQR